MSRNNAVSDASVNPSVPAYSKDVGCLCCFICGCWGMCLSLLGSLRNITSYLWSFSSTELPALEELSILVRASSSSCSGPWMLSSKTGSGSLTSNFVLKSWRWFE